MAIAVQYFRLQEWVDSVTGLVAPGGFIGQLEAVVPVVQIAPQEHVYVFAL